MNIIEPMRQYLENNNIEVYPMGNDMYKPNHDNWNINFINNNTYIMTVFRDPAKRTVSQFIETEGGSPDFKEKNNVNYFLKWVKETVFTIDPQCKCLLVEKSVYDVEESDYDFVIDKNKLKQRLNRINLFLKHQKMDYKYCEDIQEKITKGLGIDNYKNSGNVYNVGFSSINSQSLYNQLNIKQIDYLYENSSIDSEIYFSYKYDII
jgi:hypothetical protein